MPLTSAPEETVDIAVPAQPSIQSKSSRRILEMIKIGGSALFGVAGILAAADSSHAKLDGRARPDRTPPAAPEPEIHTNVIKDSVEHQERRHKERLQVFYVIHDYLVNGTDEKHPDKHFEALKYLGQTGSLPAARAFADAKAFGTLGTPADFVSARSVLRWALQNLPMTEPERRSVLIGLEEIALHERIHQEQLQKRK